MEKIQSALEKARTNRIGSLGDKLAPVRTTTARRFSKEPDALAALPQLSIRTEHLERHRIVVPSGNAGSTEIDVLRTRLLQQMRARGWRRVAITSPGPQCGKSTITANLALSLGRQPEQRTLIFDLDLHNPALARLLGITERHNAADVLSGKSPFEQSAARIGNNLAFATTCSPVREPAEILQGPRTAETLAEIEQRYAPSVMLFDTPPVLIGDSAMAFMAHVDCVLIVAAAETTTIKEIDECERELASQTQVLGVVLNKCRYTNRDSGYGTYGAR